MKTAEVQQRLRVHYCNENGSGEEWVLIPEARAGAGFSGNSSQCDLLALHTWESRGLIVVGHEIKVSRGDWLKELKNPAKADWWWKLCHQWFLVVPKPHGDIVKPGELPAGWGLLEVNDKVRVVTKPVKNGQTRTVPWPVIVGWIAQVDRREKRDLAELLRVEKHKGFEDGREYAKLHSNAEIQAAVNDEIRERARKFRAETGIDLFDENTWRRDNFAKLWKLADRFGGVAGLLSRIDAVRNNASLVVDAIDKMVAEVTPISEAVR